jgi:hypothetical protein
MIDENDKMNSGDGEKTKPISPSVYDRGPKNRVKFCIFSIEKFLKPP